jgi:cystathionine beta-lyase/cystathionine gamma-synthase
VTNDAKLFEAIAIHQNAVGAIPGPFDAWLTLRGIKTLAVRMKQHELNAKAVAEFLSGHPGVEKVHYPGLPSHPGHELAKRQMSGFGGMVSFSLTGGAAKAERFLLALKVFSLAESLGGAESLACSPAAMTHASVPPEERLRQGITQGLVRLSVGIEDADDLIEDLEQALSVAGEPDAPSHEI